MQADLERRLVAVDVRPGQRERLLDAQALHGGHTIGAQAEVAAATHNVLPQHGRLFGGHIQLVTQFAGVTAARDDNFRAVDHGRGKTEEAQRFQINIVHNRQ